MYTITLFPLISGLMTAVSPCHYITNTVKSDVVFLACFYIENITWQLINHTHQIL